MPPFLHTLWLNPTTEHALFQICPKASRNTSEPLSLEGHFKFITTIPLPPHCYHHLRFFYSRLDSSYKKD